MSAASSRRLAKPSLVLGLPALLPPAQQSVMQREKPLPPRGGCGNTLSSPSPSPQTVSGYSSSLTSFPKCPWCRRDAGSTVPAVYIAATAWRGHSTAFVGGCWASLPRSLSFAQDGGLLKYPAFPCNPTGT